MTRAPGLSSPHECITSDGLQRRERHDGRRAPGCEGFIQCLEGEARRRTIAQFENWRKQKSLEAKSWGACKHGSAVLALAHGTVGIVLRQDRAAIVLLQHRGDIREQTGSNVGILSPTMRFVTCNLGRDCLFLHLATSHSTNLRAKIGAGPQAVPTKPVTSHLEPAPQPHDCFSCACQRQLHITGALILSHTRTTEMTLDA